VGSSLRLFVVTFFVVVPLLFLFTAAIQNDEEYKVVVDDSTFLQQGISRSATAMEQAPCDDIFTTTPQQHLGFEDHYTLQIPSSLVSPKKLNSLAP
jgi:hypothetical protein